MATSSGQGEIPSLKTPPRSMRWQFIVGWFVILSLHGLCLAYFVGVGILYATFLPGPGSGLRYQLRTFSIGISETEYPKVARVHEIIAALHAFFILLMLGGSLRKRKLVFYPSLRAMSHKLASMMIVVRHTARQSYRFLIKTGTEETRTDSNRLRSLSGHLNRVRHAVFSKQGLLGVDSAYFDHLNLVRQVVTTSLQTYQAYRMSHLLPRFWLTRLYLVLLVTNCWIVPILQRIYKQHQPTRRLMSVLCDVVLGLFSSMGISLAIFASYLPQYTDLLYGFPMQNFYIDEWFINLYQEFQMMVVMSWNEMGSRLVFAFSVLTGMHSIKELLTDAFAEMPYKGPNKSAAIAPERIKMSSSQLVAKQFEAPTSRYHKTVHFIVHVVGPACFVLWGILIAIIHIYAEVHYVNIPCKLPLRPWFTTKPACSLVEIDCHQVGASGSLDSLTKDWTVFEPSLAAGLVIRHCPDLTVPPTMQSFTDLITLKTYNTTISSWPETAGLTTAQARLRVIYLIRTNFTNAVFPPGLVRPDFPSTMSSFVTSVTNLASLPDSLNTVWPKLMSIMIEFASLTVFPDVLIGLNPTLVSLSYTPITSVPTALFEIPALQNLAISYTAIQEVPRNVTKLTPSIESLVMEGTNVSVLWSWMEPIITHAYVTHSLHFMAADTPYCRERAEIVNGTRNQFSVPMEPDLASVMDVSTPDRLQYSLESVMCISYFKTVYPLIIDDMTQQVRG